MGPHVRLSSEIPKKGKAGTETVEVVATLSAKLFERQR